MSKPKLIQKYGGWVCTGIHPCTNVQITRWRETPREAYEEYLKACKEVEALRLRIKQYEIAHIPLDRLTELGKTTHANDFRTERAYPYYDTSENDSDTIDTHSYVWVACVAVLSFIVYLFVC